MAAAKFIPIALYMIVGIISMTMAVKNIFSKKFIPFHEQAAGKSWNEIDQGIQFVVQALMKVAGFGFLVVALLLMIFPIVNYFINDFFTIYAIPAISLIYSLGLALVNYQLSHRTMVKTPWKRSLCAALLIAAGMLISWLSR